MFVRCLGVVINETMLSMCFLLCLWVICSVVLVIVVVVVSQSV